MGSLTNAQMRSLGQKLVVDTSTVNPGLAPADWTDLLNEAQYFYGSLFPEALTISASQASGAGQSFSFTPTQNWRAIMHIERADKYQMEKQDLNTVRRLLADDSNAAVPRMWAAHRALVPDAWTVYIYPAGTTNTLTIWGLAQPTALSGDSDTTPFQDHECRVIARLAAVEAARILGRAPDFISNIAQSLPDRLREQAQTIKRLVQPRDTGGKTFA